MTLPQVRLKIARRSSHPWIFQKMVEKPPVKIANGSVVDILDREGQWVGRGLWNSHSRIALRVLTAREEEAIDEAFFQRAVDRAVQLRRGLLKLDDVTDAYRVVHSEGDGLSGLVVDRFGSTLVLEFFSAGMHRFREVIQDALSRHYPESRFYWFAEDHVRRQESFECRPPKLPPSCVITEHGLRFRITPGGKHKTGFFLDQRDNRHNLASFCAGKRVLDLCCNTGAFALYARSLGHAEEVVGVDLDEEAVEAARHNANLNQLRIRFVRADLFPWLRDVVAAGQRFDVVVLDPSKQTRDRETVTEAIRRYQDMNRLAMQAVAEGGVLLTCSCTGLVTEVDFLDMLRRAAWQARKQLQIFRVAGAAPDHPFLAHVPESRYLKAVSGRVFSW